MHIFQSAEHLKQGESEKSNRDLAQHLNDLLREYHIQGREKGIPTDDARIVEHTYSDGVQVFWVAPRIEEERRAVSWAVDQGGIRVASGWLKLDRE